MSLINLSMEKDDRLSSLRSLLAEKFPIVSTPAASILSTGHQALDENEGGLRKGAMTELVGGISAGGIFLEIVLEFLRREKCFAALIDTKNGFDPQDSHPVLTRLIWVMCQQVPQAIKVADLLIRDGNLSLVLLDLQSAEAKELGKIPASTWHRFQRLLESTNTVFVVMTSRPLAQGASTRIKADQSWKLPVMREKRSALIQRFRPKVFSRCHFSMEPERKSA